jgi:hypothetical protein
MSQLAQDVGFLKLAADVLLRILSLNLVEINQLANQLLLRLDVVCEADDCFRSLAKTMVTDAILACKQLGQSASGSNW